MKIEDLQKEIEELKGKIENLQFIIVAINYHLTELENIRRENAKENLEKYGILTDWIE